MSVKQELQTAVKKDRTILGANETIKHIDDLEHIIIASNTPEDIASAVEDAADEAGVNVTRFEGTNKELGSLCRKPFTVSTVGIQKADSTGA